MRRLLLVEDDPLIANIYQRKFTQDGYMVIHAKDGQAALDELSEETPDLVILDIMLPVVSGLDVLQEIRSDPARKELPVIVFSNAYQSKLIDKAWATGATSVLMKGSTNPLQLSRIVGELLEGQPKQSATPTAKPKPFPPPSASPPPTAPEPEDTDTQIQERGQFLGGLSSFFEGFKGIHESLLTSTEPK